MSRVLAGITISVDGFITGPGDGPGCGLGVGGERLHYWVFGGPWSYDSPGRGESAGEDKAWLEETMGANGVVIAGGKRALPNAVRSDLELLDTRRFACGAVYLRYRPKSA
jgi:hypothetical protein